MILRGSETNHYKDLLVPWTRGTQRWKFLYRTWTLDECKPLYLISTLNGSENIQFHEIILNKLHYEVEVEQWGLLMSKIKDVDGNVEQWWHPIKLEVVDADMWLCYGNGDMSQLLGRWRRKSMQRVRMWSAIQMTKKIPYLCVCVCVCARACAQTNMIRCNCKVWERIKPRSLLEL